MPPLLPAMAQGTVQPPAVPAPEQKLQEETAQLLDRLFAQLHKADNEKTAQAIEKAIWGLWAKSGSSTADALLQQASRAMSASAYPVALRILDTIIEVKPDFAEAWNKRATLYYLERKFDRSLSDIDVVLDLEPRHFGALSGLGMIRRELGDDKAALDAYRRALVIHPFQQGARRAVKELESEFEQKI
ncbi:MAG: tetratricopeptide repeat protein [Aestuariivirgaceae bacterium]